MTKQIATDNVLLGVLMTGPKHGYEIRKFLDDSLESKWHIGSSQMYVLLKNLEQKQLVESILTIQNKKPSKKTYFITQKGRDVFLEWIGKPVMHVRDLRIELLAKLFFVDLLSLGFADGLIQNQIDILTRILENISEKEVPQTNPFEILSLRFRQITIEACLYWLKTEGLEFIEKVKRR
ncbi:MAG TPA: PadR family transcriptional regulator [Desulfobacteraceae bacterium]|nr:PadR family transcriptional regulator [Desulfobacteraceae bacterium]